MEIIKPQISVSITKTELNSLITEAMSIPDYAAAIKRILSPLLAESFPQFPEFTNVTIGDTDESGITQVILKQPPVSKSNGAIKSIEPAVIDTPKEEVATKTEDDLANTLPGNGFEAAAHSDNEATPEASAPYIDPFDS